MATATLTPAVEPLADEPLYEVIDGQVVEKPAWGAYQAWIGSILTSLLHGHATANSVGRVVTEVLFTLDAPWKLKRRPDVAFVSYDLWPRRQPVPDQESWDVVPDLAVEVISPSNRAADVMKKVGDYFRTGVRLVWVVYTTEQLVYVYRSATEVRILQASDDLDGGDVLPGFRRPVKDLFEEESDEEPGPAAG
jgi:Uma2 family endonuclease